MASLNRVTLIGHLGADPDIRTFQNGNKVCNLRIATSERWRDKNTGENRERTEWHQVAIFSEGLVRVCQEYLKKGSLVLIEGKLQTRKWQDQSGNDRYSTEVVLQGFDSKMLMLGGRQDGGASGASPSGDCYSNSEEEQKKGYRGYGGEGSENHMDDEVPF